MYNKDEATTNHQRKMTLPYYKCFVYLLTYSLTHFSADAEGPRDAIVIIIIILFAQ